MKTSTQKGLPELTDAQIAGRLGLAWARGTVTVTEALRRGAALQRLKVRAVERAIERRIADHKGPQGQQAQLAAPSGQIRKTRSLKLDPRRRAELEQLSKQLARYRAAATDAEDEERFAVARGKLSAVPGLAAAAYGRAVDAAGKGHGGVIVTIQSTENQVVAKTVTDDDGYFAIQAPAGAKGDLHLSVAGDTKGETLALTRAGKPLPVARTVLRVDGAPGGRGKAKAATDPAPESTPVSSRSRKKS